MKTIVLEKMPDLFWEKIAENRWEKYFFTPKNEMTSYDKIEIVIIRTRVIFHKELFEKFPKLKMIIRAGTGFDNIDIEEGFKRGIIICNTPEANAPAAFEQTISYIFALIKQQPIMNSNLLNHLWKNGLKMNLEIEDLRILIVGVGRIGKRVANAMKLLGAKVKGVDPYLSEAEIQESKIDFIDYESGLKWCNLLTFHCPLTFETKNYFNMKSFDLLSNPIFIVNCARGLIVNEMALNYGLRNNLLLGVALDVFEQEPNPKITFQQNKNVILSPHIGAYTKKSKNRMALETLFVWSQFVFKKVIIRGSVPKRQKQIAICRTICQIVY